MGHDVFVSHSSKDKIYADALVAHLERSGIRCWVAPRDILAGANWAGSILKAIADSKLMVLVFSGHTNSSNHIRREVERAVHHGIPVAPVRIADVQPTDDLEYFLSSSHWMDAITPPMEAHFSKLADTIKVLLKLPVDAPGIASLLVASAASAPAAMQNRRRRWPWSAGVAALVALVTLGFIIFNHGTAPPNSRAPTASMVQTPVAPAAAATAPSPPSVPLSPRETIHSDLKETKIGDTWTNSLGMKFAYIPAGSFVMGSPADEAGRVRNEIQHKVTLTRSFLMATTHVTKGQFAAFVQDSGYQTDAQKQGWAFAFDGKGFTKVNGASWRNPGFDQGDDHPVVCVSWNDATAFCDWLSRKEAKHCRLPTEAEWEYAARAGTQTAYPWGNNPDDGRGWANCADQTTKQKIPDWTPFNWTDGYAFTSPVGKFKPNAWGLYDMIGNAWEWCGDWYGDYPNGETTNPRGADNGTARVLRGGSWGNYPRNCRCAYRGNDHGPNERGSNGGFRVVLDSEWTNSLGMTFAYIPAGSFVMGSPADEPGRFYNETQHKVTLTKGFLMGKTHVTRGQFAAFAQDSGFQTDAEKEAWAIAFDGKGFSKVNGASWRNPGFDQLDDHPVVEISWNDATAFCAWLSHKEGKHYRLPTEAEWEYSCRAGTQTAYPWGNDPDDGQGWANCADQTAKQRFPNWTAFSWADRYVFTSPVGKFEPNAFGLYDMIGNAVEWCDDCYDNYPDGDATDPAGPGADNAPKFNVPALNYNGPARVLRGGSWNDGPQGCRCALRYNFAPVARNLFVGFRVVLDSE